MTTFEELLNIHTLKTVEVNGIYKTKTNYNDGKKLMLLNYIMDQAEPEKLAEFIEPFLEHVNSIYLNIWYKRCLEKSNNCIFEQLDVKLFNEYCFEKNENLRKLIDLIIEKF
jgi:hypothetical protein